MNKEIDYRRLINVYNCDAAKLGKVDAVQGGLDRVLNDVKPTAKHFFYQFEPQGVTGLMLWREGHFSIHTWPERGMAAIDVVGYPYEGRNLLRRLQSSFPAQYVPVQSTRAVKKGTPQVGQQVVGTLERITHYSRLEQEEGVIGLLKDISQSAGFHVVGEVVRSEEQFIDAAVILSESHLSIHYNKRTRSAKVDIFTCGKEGDPNKGYELLKYEIGARESQRVYVRR